MTWSRAHTVIAGLGLVALTNAVALLGVVYNRSGEPEAKVSLTQRELRAPYRSYGNRENSGLALGLVWRVLNEESVATQFYMWRYAGIGGTPAWLDKARMQALGFDTSAHSIDSDPRGRARYEKQLPREVLLVLELDGPAYRRSLELATQYAARDEAKLAAIPGDKELGARAKNAREALEWERNRNSRLFVVDAGLESAALRAKYPDAGRYALVHGQVRLESGGRDSGNVRGYVSGLSIESINVPFALREVFGSAAPIGDVDQNRAPFAAMVAFGKRLEPWITAAAKK
jgi:hypothetical protein